MRLYTAREWALLGWHRRELRRLSLLALVAQLEREHVATYGPSHPAYEGTRGARKHVRTGVLNRSAA